MDTSPELRSAISNWQQSANQLIAVARWGARQRPAELSGEEYGQAPDPDADVDDFLGHAGAITDLLAAEFGSLNTDIEGSLDEAAAGSLESKITVGLKDDEVLGDQPRQIQDLLVAFHERSVDPDAATRALALVSGCLAVADALLGAADEPETVLADRRLRVLSDYGLAAEGEVEPFAGVMLGGVRGGADGPKSPIPTEIGTLGDSAGGETVALVTTTIVGSGVIGEGRDGIDAVRNGLRGVLDYRTVESKFGKIARLLDGLRNSFKRAATRIVGWIVEHAQQLVPAGVAKFVAASFDHLATILNEPGHAVGLALTTLFGANAVESKWNAAGQSDVDQSIVQPYLQHIAWITTGRCTIDRWAGNVVFDLARKWPHVQLAYCAAVAVAVVFVAVQVDLGLRALDSALVY